MRLKNFRAPLLALILMVLISLASAAFATSLFKMNSVSIEDATSVAESHTEMFSGISTYADWKDANVQKAATYYDLNGKVSAYSFEVFVKNQYAGYMIISATRDNYVCEFSRGKTPDSELSTQNESRELAAAESPASDRATPLPVLVPALSLGVAFSLRRIRGGEIR